ncbi:cyclase [Streptomyces violaceusniger]|uniref:SRPBCC family protein n=2 Tax=Streptomyces violaceusniger group TaxID=2839105 RepID=A0ABD5J7M6_9ACTN|nr:SRPBCC family protein [Streptomyces violaceusniger]KUL44380.1 cyclase [Streptomyces violaceusniger]MEE4583698.1 SRPBCC family protein [Streptomyces sp. DSM 41602]
MADTLGKLKDDIVGNPATDRLKDELRNYVQARATHAISGLGTGLAKGAQSLAEGKSPGQALMKAGSSQLKDSLKESLKEKVKGAFGKGRGKSGGGKSKSVTVVEDIDVGVPVREAYDQWTQFQEFSTFAKGVVSVEKADDTSSNWKVKVAKSTRSWRANVTEQVPDERITWTTEGAKGTVKGVVTFHPLGDNLTRVLLVLEYFPKGLFEKTGNIWRAQGRRARLDLKLYRKFIMMRGEATDGWRGEIRDGEVVRDHETAVEEEERDNAGDEAGGEADEPRSGSGDESEAEGDAGEERADEAEDAYEHAYEDEGGAAADADEAPEEEYEEEPEDAESEPESGLAEDEEDAEDEEEPEDTEDAEDAEAYEESEEPEEAEEAEEAEEPEEPKAARPRRRAAAARR